MNDEPRVFGLACVDGRFPAPVLQGVHAEGRLDGVLFELTLRQTYRNTSARVLEVVYTFPLPLQAVLLGFASELNGERKVGTIVPKPAAEREYEKALGAGDAPVMLEALADGLHTANIGNLKPGDEIVLEVRFAQLLTFEQERLRIAIPTTIAPRYGNAEQSGLAPQQVPHASLDAEYGIALSVVVGGALAGGTVECPTHSCTRAPTDSGIRLTLDAGSWLDRDVVIVVTPREPLPSLVVQAEDTLSTNAPVVVMAALQPRPPAQRERIALKLLVDCSGSMAGDSIASARAALAGALADLHTSDRVSLSRFGSTLEHLQAPTACAMELLRLLGRTITGIEADLGGTEMAAALKGVLALSMDADGAGSDVLLITDGEIWQTEETIAAARASKHRVFVIGVGSSPAEGVLRGLADATGGACEFATPGEALEAAAMRMLARMRQVSWHDLRIDWGSEPVWQTVLPAGVFGGDTVVAFAGMNKTTSNRAVRLLAVDASGAMTEVARGEADAPAPGDSLPRIAAMRRMTGASPEAARKLATKYQLLGAHTSCILVHERTEADKSTQQAELHRVSSMLAAGWGATASVTPRSRHDRVRATALGSFGSTVRFCLVKDKPQFEASPRRKSARPEPASLKDVALAVFAYLTGGGDVATLAAHCASLRFAPDVRLAVDQAAGLAGGEGQALLVLAYWVNSQPAGEGRFFAVTALQSHVDALDPSSVKACVGLFEQTLSEHSPAAVAKSRAERLRQALRRAGLPDDAVI